MTGNPKLATREEGGAGVDGQTDRQAGAEGTGRYACAPSLLLQLLLWVLSHGTQGSYGCWDLIPPHFVPKALKGATSLEGSARPSFFTALCAQP